MDPATWSIQTREVEQGGGGRGGGGFLGFPFFFGPTLQKTERLVSGIR